ERIEGFLQRFHPEALPLGVEVQDDTEHRSKKWVFTTRHLGIERTTTLDVLFFESPDFLTLRRLADDFESVGAPPYLISYDEEAVEVPTLEVAVERILDDARK